MAEFAGGPLTILFSDVEGSTDLRTQRGDAAAHRILRAHEEVVHRCVAAHDGTEIKALGDGFMVVFTSIRAALECAVAIQQELEERNIESPGEELRVRIGINFGEVTVEDGDLYGQAVNAAARIAGKARGGEILVSEVVRQLVGSGPEFTFADRGRLRLKGFPDRWHLYGVVYDRASPGRAGPGLAGRTPFVGRESERADLRRLVTQVKAGAGALVMIGGEPGVGKTRLAEELAVRCEREGFARFSGHCYEAAGAAPYIPIVEALEQALARAPSPKEFRKFLGDEAPEIAKLVPKLRQLCPDIPPALELPAEQERRYLFSAAWEVLARTAGAQPTLLVLDDIHWADEPTMLLIQHCAERLADVPVLMVGLYRDSELDVGRPLSRTFDELIRRHLVRRISLRRLPEDGVAAMLAALAGQEPPPRLVEIIYAETEGNPFFTEEVFKHLAEEGRLFDADGNFRAGLSVDDLDVPESVRLVVGARLSRLGENGSKVLGSAAVLGRVFSFELLQHIEEMSEERLLDVVEAAERTGLVKAIFDGGDDRFIFAHELIRQTVLGELSAPRRRRLHARVADALERHYSESLDQHASSIAQHLLDAGITGDGRAFRYLMRAGRWAMQGAGFEEALRHYERALALEDVAEGSDHARLLFEVGSARASVGQLDGAIDAWRRSLDAYEELGDAQAAGEVCVAACYNLTFLGRYVEGMELGQRGLVVLGDSLNPDRGRLLGMTAFPTAFAGVYQAAMDKLDEEANLARQLGDDALLGHALGSMAMTRMAHMELTGLVEAGFPAIELLRAVGDLWNAVAVSGFVAFGLTFLGRFDELRAWVAEFAPLVERLGHYTALAQHSRSTGLTRFFTTGDLEQLEAFALADRELMESTGMPWVSGSWSWQGLAQFLRGNWDEAQLLFEEAVRLEPPGALCGWHAALLFECLAYRGHKSEALAILETQSLPGPGEPKTWGAGGFLVIVVEGLTVLGERDAAAELYPSVVDVFERTGVICPSFEDGRLYERAAGIAAAAARRWDDAERHFRTALEQAETLPHRPEAAHTRRWYAHMLLDRSGPGDRERAEELARAAVEDYERMGMRRHRELAAALL